MTNAVVALKWVIHGLKFSVSVRLSLLFHGPYCVCMIAKCLRHGHVRARNHADNITGSDTPLQSQYGLIL